MNTASQDVSVESRLNAMKSIIAQGAAQLMATLETLNSVRKEPDLAMRIRQMQVNDGHRIGNLFLPPWYGPAQDVRENLAIVSELMGLPLKVDGALPREYYVNLNGKGKKLMELLGAGLAQLRQLDPNSYENNPIRQVEELAVLADASLSTAVGILGWKDGLSPSEKGKVTRVVNEGRFLLAQTHYARGNAYFTAGLKLAGKDKANGGFLLSNEALYGLEAACRNFDNAHKYLASVKTPTLRKRNADFILEFYSEYATSAALLADDSVSIAETMLNWSLNNPNAPVAEYDILLGFSEVEHALSNYNLVLQIVQTAPGLDAVMDKISGRPQFVERVEKAIAGITADGLDRGSQLGVPRIAERYVLNGLR